MSDVSELVKDLAVARKNEAEEKAILDSINAEIQAQYGERLELAQKYLSTARIDVADAEAKLEKAVSDQYKVDGNKKPHPALMVKIYTVLEYDPGVALDYCRQHLPNAVKLDKAQFEKVAKVAGLHFVEAKDDPRLTIARDLSQWIE